MCLNGCIACAFDTAVSRAASHAAWLLGSNSGAWRGGRELVMPRAALTDDEGAKALEAAGTDIKYLLSRHEVSLDNQKLFFHHGVTTLEKLSNFAKDRDDLALVFKDHWELDASRSLEERVQVAAITCAFTNAKTRSQRAAEVDAEYDTLQWSRPVVAGEWAAMRSALEKRYGHLEDKIYPSKEYIEKKLVEVEHGEYRAEELTEVVSKEEIEADSVVPIWDSKGRLAMRRGSTLQKWRNRRTLKNFDAGCRSGRTQWL